MNFLNKKHVPTHANTHSNFNLNHSNTKSFNINQQSQNHDSYLPNRIQPLQNNKIRQSQKILYQNTSSSRIKKQDANNFNSSYTGNHMLRTSPSLPMIPSNLCSQHQNQILRHLCLECNQLLCAQCISDHLEGHRQTANTIPKIETINKLKKQMIFKVQNMLYFMQQSNHQSILPQISILKVEALQKIHKMKVEVIKSFEQWCKILENHILTDLIKIEDTKNISDQMYKIKQEVIVLRDQLKNPSNNSVQTVKRVHQIDSEKLEAAYLEMFNKFSKSILKSKFSFQINWKSLMESFENSIKLKSLYPEKHQIDESENLQRNDLKNNLNAKQNDKIENLVPQIDEDKKLFEIQSIESFLEPNSRLSSHNNLQKQLNTRNIYNQVEQSKFAVQRTFSRQGSGKRLSIFSGEQRKNTQNVIDRRNQQ